AVRPRHTTAANACALRRVAARRCTRMSEHRLLPDLEMRGASLLDERNSSMRDVIGALMQRASHADFAVARIRLAAISLSASELQHVRCRVVLGRLDVASLDIEGGNADARAFDDLL